jgi:hypothetical protein
MWDWDLIPFLVYVTETVVQECLTNRQRSNTRDDCEFLPAYNSESEVVFFCYCFGFHLIVFTSLFGIDTQDDRPAPRSKRGPQTWSDSATWRGRYVLRVPKPVQQPDAAGTCYVSPNQFAVLSVSDCDTEGIAVPSQPSSRKSRIPPIVICRCRNNHSATLKK